MAECVRFNLFQSKRFLYIDSDGFLHYVFFWNEKSLPQSRYVIHLSEERNTPGKPKEPSLWQTLPKRIAKCVSSPFTIFQQLTSKAGNRHEGTINVWAVAISFRMKPGFSGNSPPLLAAWIAGGNSCAAVEFASHA